MAGLMDLLETIWHTPNRQMAWGRIPARQVIGARASAPFAVKDDYVVVRLGSMFLKDSRVLWLKLSPLAHAVVTLLGRDAPRSDTAVIGPAQFGDLATASAERTVILNQRLAGPAVWRGGDIVVASGLFAVPKDEAASALLDTLGQLAGLGIPGLKQGADIAGIVKSGVEGLIGLKGTKPVLGVKDALGDPRTAVAGSEAAPCVLAAVAAPAAEVDFTKLWIREGRLWSGASADALQPYEARDHLLVVVERGPPREDWRGLPKLSQHEAAFDAALRATSIARDAMEARMNEIFAAFDADLTVEPDLTNPDKDRIRGEVIAEVQARMGWKYGGPFGAPKEERRSIAGIAVSVDASGFDFLAVGGTRPETVKPMGPGARPF
jgi:hypothetical protein